MATNPTPQQLANQALAPVLAEIERQKSEEARRTRQQQATAQGAAGGLAQVLGQIAPQTEQTYQAAAGATGSLAKGFSDAFAAASNGSAANLNDFLAKQGSPQQVQAAGQAGADVLYGLGGYIPASNLLREGAAFTSAAQQLPATARGVGNEQSAVFGRESLERLRQLDAARRQERAKLPGLTQDIRSQQDDARLKARAQALNEAIAEEELGIKKGQLDVSKANAVTSRQNAATSRMNANLAASNARFNQLLSKANLELRRDEFDLAVTTEQRMSKPKAKGGFTAKQKQDMSQTAFQTAADDFDAGNGAKDGVRPVDTLRDLIAAGIPFSVAIRAIQRFGRQPGADNYWKATLGWTKKGKKR